MNLGERARCCRRGYMLYLTSKRGRVKRVGVFCMCGCLLAGECRLASCLVWSCWLLSAGGEGNEYFSLAICKGEGCTYLSRSLPLVISGTSNDAAVKVRGSIACLPDGANI